jgi:hypothetical protein
MISSASEKIIERFTRNLQRHFKDQLKLSCKKNVLEIAVGKENLKIGIFKENIVELYKSTSCVEEEKTPDEMRISVALDQLVRREQQIFSIIRSKLQLNKKIFARKCTIKKINVTYAKLFLDAHHLMAYATAAFHYGLFSNDDLMAVAAFSKGRRMDRLPADKRSFELVRFCCKDGITVTGGLSKLITHFITEKQPGDIMTYVDKQWSYGSGYLKCGFKLIGETKKQEFIVNKSTFERNYYKGEDYDERKSYLVQNGGNLKLLYTI